MVTTESNGSLLLKWGTIKGWEGLDAAAMEKLQEFSDLGMSMGAAQQVMTDAHKDKLCELIDLVDEIQNDWTGEDMTPEEAKKYVREYGQ